MKRTQKDIDYQAAPYGRITIIPKGARLIPADNLPQGGYWVENWRGMSEKVRSWARNHGFHVTEEDLT